MNRTKRLFQLAIATLVVILAGCTSSVKDTPEISVSPTKEFTGKNSFGDGYIAHIPINDVKEASQEEIVKILVTQWLDHYKTESTQSDAIVKDYTIDKITLIDIKTHKDDPAMPIIAMVKFSIIPPEQIPNEWRCYSTSPDKPWCHVELRFGIYGNEEVSQYYWLGIMSNAG